MLTMLLPGKKLSLVSFGSVLLTGVLAATVLTAAPAAGSDFPSWDEVEQAKHSVEAKAQQAAEIEALLGELSEEAGSLGNAAVQASADHQRAAAEAETNRRALDVLAVQRLEAAGSARELSEQMGALAAQTYKTGGMDSSLLMLLDADAAVGAMDRLTTLQGITGRTGTLHAEASAAANVLHSLEARESAAVRVREESAAESLQLLAAAEAAAATAEAAVREQEERSAVLLAQLADLRDSSVQLEDERLRGLQAEEAFRQQQAAREAEAAAREAERKREQEQGGGRGGLTPPPVANSPDPVINPTPAPESPRPNPVAPAPPPPPAAPAPKPAPSPAPAPGPAPVDDPAAAQAYAAGRLGAFGWRQDQQRCLVNLWQRESGWRTSALNPSSGAYGIPQSMPGNKMASAGSDWRTNYRTQIAWGLGYIGDRHGSPCAAWQHSEDHNWY